MPAVDHGVTVGSHSGVDRLPDRGLIGQSHQIVAGHRLEHTQITQHIAGGRRQPAQVAVDGGVDGLVIAAGGHQHPQVQWVTSTAAVQNSFVVAAGSLDGGPGLGAVEGSYVEAPQQAVLPERRDHLRHPQHRAHGHDQRAAGAPGGLLRQVIDQGGRQRIEKARVVDDDRR